MFLSIFSKKNKSKKKLDELKKLSKQDYENCIKNNNTIGNLRLRNRLALRSKANVEKTFIDAAKNVEIYQKIRLEASLTNNNLELTPPKIETSYQILQTDKGLIVSYIPFEYAEEVFKIGASYQNSELSVDQSKKKIENIFNRICKELNIYKEIPILEFLDDNASNKLDT
jgi:NAD+--asparagine ADP-ribosyltransferase